jgi:hypothetical protein
MVSLRQICLAVKIGVSVFVAVETHQTMYYIGRKFRVV